MNTEEMMNQLTETIEKNGNVKVCFGEPYEKDSLTIIPVAKMKAGGGGGTGTANGSGKTKDNGKNESFKKIEPSMYDEINTLIDTYNDMLSGRIEYNRQLRQLNNDLVERNTALESIACSLYHESQTPLTTIGGYLNVLDSAVKEGDMLTAKETIHVLSNAATSLSKSYKKMGDSIREELENPAEEK